MSIGWPWYGARLLLTEQIMRAMSFECTRTHSMRGLDVLNEMEECLSTNRLKMKGLFCRRRLRRLRWRRHLREGGVSVSVRKR